MLTVVFGWGRKYLNLHEKISNQRELVLFNQFLVVL